eukprot:s4359_g3.t1
MKPNVARILEAINKLDADVIALQEVGIPECLGESGRWSAKDGELTPKKEGSPDADDGASLVEAMPRQLFDSTGVALGSAKTKEDGTVLLKHLSELGYCEGVYSPAFRSDIAGFMCGNAVLSRYSLEHVTTVMLDRNRADDDRTAAVVRLRHNKELPTVVSTHLDVFAEMRGYFGMAEGEAIRLLEFEALHEAKKTRMSSFWVTSMRLFSFLLLAAPCTKRDIGSSID